MADYNIMDLLGVTDPGAQSQASVLADAIRGKRAIAALGAIGSPAMQALGAQYAKDAESESELIQRASGQRAGLDNQRLLAGITDAMHRAQLAEQARHNKAGEALAQKQLDWQMTPQAPAAADPAKLAKTASELRKELQGNQVYKNTAGVAEAYRKILGTSDTGAGDMSLIYGYMKLLDPGSTVREGEYATAAQSGSVPARIVGMYNRALSGEKLAPEIRKQFKDEAGRVFRAQHSQYEGMAQPYRRLAQQSGVDPSDVVLDLGVQQFLPGTAAPAGSSGAASPPRKQINGKWYEQRADGWYEVD